MTDTFHCPKGGAPLDYDRSVDVVPTSGYPHSLALRGGNKLFVVTSSSEVLGYSLGQP